MVRLHPTVEALIASLPNGIGNAARPALTELCIQALPTATFDIGSAMLQIGRRGMILHDPDRYSRATLRRLIRTVDLAASDAVRDLVAFAAMREDAQEEVAIMSGNDEGRGRAALPQDASALTKMPAWAWTIAEPVSAILSARGQDPLDLLTVAAQTGTTTIDLTGGSGGTTRAVVRLDYPRITVRLNLHDLLWFVDRPGGEFLVRRYVPHTFRSAVTGMKLGEVTDVDVAGCENLTVAAVHSRGLFVGLNVARPHVSLAPTPAAMLADLPDDFIAIWGPPRWGRPRRHLEDALAALARRR